MGNSSNAYAAVKPIDVSLSDTIVKQQELGLKRRAERREIAKDEAEVDKEKDSKAKELAKYTSKLNPYDTGSTTYNTTIATALTEAKGKALEQWKIANDKSKTEEERSIAYANLEDINNYPDYLKNVSDRITEVNTTYATQLKKGEIFRNEDWEKKFQNGFAGMTVKMNDQFRPDTLFIDKNGDGIQDAEVSDIIKYDQVNQLLPEGISMPRIDLGSLAYKIGKDLGKTTTKDVNGYETTNTVQVTDETARAGIQPLMTDQNVRSYLRLKGDDYNQELTPKLLKTVEDDLVKTALSNTDITNENGFNYSDQNADNSLAETKKQHRISNALNKDKWKTMKKKAENDDQTPRISGTTVPSVNTWGKGAMNLIDTKTTRAVNISKGGVKLKAIKTNTTKNDKQFIISDGTVENFTYGKKGEFLIEVSYPKTTTKDGKPGKYTKEVLIGSSETELRIAESQGLSVEEFRKTAIIKPNPIRFDSQGNLID